MLNSTVAFARRSWATQDEGESFVQDASFGVAKAAKGDGAISDGVEGLGENLGAEGQSVLARDANHGDSTRAWGGGDGANRGTVNCVAKGGVHGANLARFAAHSQTKARQSPQINTYRT